MRLLKSLVYQLIDSFQTYKKEGVQAGLAKLSKTILRIFYTQLDLIVLAKSLPESASLLELTPGLVIHQIKEKEELALFNPFVSPKEAVRLRQIFDDGDVAFAALQDGQLAGWGWITYKINSQTNRVHIPLAPGEATLYDLFVLPAYRGKGIAQQLVNSRLQLLREQGYRRVVINCTKGNIPAIKLAEKAGYVCVGESCHTRILFWDHLVYRPYPPVEK